ncbi:MAG: PKD domain-containing protein [Bacteroidota bacterium]
MTFSPTDYSNLKVWLKSTDGLSISSGAISNWADQSATSANFQQSNPTSQPTLSGTSILNGYPYLLFGGQAQLLSNLNYSFADASIFVVATQNTLDNAYGRILDHDFQTGFWLGRDASNNNVGGGFTDSNSPYGNFIPVANEAPFIYSMVRHSDTTFSFLNHIPHAPPYRITSNLSTQSNSISIGATLNGSFFGHKNIFEIIIYDRLLNTLEQQQVEAYLNNKYAPPLQLTDTILTCTLPVTLRAKKDHFNTYTWQDNSINDSLVVNSFGKYFLTVTDVFGRISSDTVYVLQNTNNIFVDLPTDTAACAGSIIALTAGEPYFTYLWSTSTSSNTINVSTSGLYKVTMTDCVGNISKDSIQVNIHPIPVFNLGNDTIICSNVPFTLKPNLLPLQNSSFVWQDSSTDSTMQVNTPGKYTLLATDDIGCNFKDSIVIAIDSQLNNVLLGNDTTFCSGNQINVLNPPSAGVTYSWSTGASSSSITITNTGQYSIVITNTNNCVVKDTINVTVSGYAPTANFSTNIGCLNTPVLFTNLSLPPSGNVIDSTIWYFGDLSSANTSTLTNPSHTYTSTGTYTVNLKVKTDSGCQQSISKIITVYPVPTATFVSGTSCQNDTTYFMNQSTSTSGYSITSLSWNFGDTGPDNFSTLNNPKHLFSNQGNHFVTLVVTNNVGCTSTVTRTVSVQAEVKANFTYSSPCANTPTLFQSTSIAPLSNTTYSWNFGNSTANTQNAIKTFASSGVFPVTFTVDGGNGCTSVITKYVNVFLSPLVNFSIPAFCSKDTIQITNSSNAQSGVISSYNWRLNNTSFSAIQSPSLSLTTAGTYSVRLTVANSVGCKDSITKVVTVFPLPTVDFTTNPAIYYYINAPVNFIPSITNASSYTWNLTGSPTLTLQSPTVLFDTVGSYVVSLNLKDQNGCRNSKTKTITLLNRYLDLAILNVTTQKDADGFMTVSADMANYGSVPITTFDLQYQISDAGNIKETWNGNLSPYSFYSYTFVAKSASTPGSSNNITCVEIEKVNTIDDENLNNNTLCNTLNTNDISVSNPLPNPTEGDIILPVTLNRDIDYTIAIYNSVGQIQYEETTEKGLAGLNFVHLPTASYARGCYIIKLIIDGKIFIKKFIKIASE